MRVSLRCDALMHHVPNVPMLSVLAGSRETARSCVSSPVDSLVRDGTAGSALL